VDGQRPENRRPDNRRLDGEFKSQVIAATNIVELIGKTVSLKKAGRNYVGLCPFHSEKSPSFNVDPVKQFYHCFGCKKSGDVITFVMERDRIGFLDALRLLGDAAGMEMPRFNTGAAKEKAGQRKLLLDANSAAGVFFEKLLADGVIGKAGRAYLQERGFNDESVKNFHIGLAANAWDGLLRSPLMKAYPPQLLAAAGLVKTRESGTGFYDTFRNRLMFPIRDENGRVIAFGGRVMPGSEDKAKYLNSPETPVFSKSRTLFGLDLARQKIVETRTVAVVEGYTDVVMAHQYGATNVVSPLGTALTDGHVQILRRFADRIVLLFDADAAGDLAVNRAVELFLTQPVEIAIASMPDGVDPDEFLLANGLPAFEAVLKNAADALTYKWKQLSRAFNASGNDLTGQQHAVEQYLELLAGARGSGPVDSLRWGSALARVSRLTDIPVEDLNRRFRQKKAKPVMARPVRTQPATFGNDVQGDGSNEPTNGSPPPRKPTGPLTARDRSERWILSILLNQPHRWSDLQHQVTVQHFGDQDRRQLAEAYWNHQRDEGEPAFNEFLASLADVNLQSLAVSLVEEFETMHEPEDRLKEAVAFLVKERQQEEENKQIAIDRRTSVAGGETSGSETAVTVDPNEWLRKQQEKARRPDLRRTGK
jgi:DNA primase